MGKQESKDTVNPWGDQLPKALSPGVKLVRTLRGHTNAIGRIAWSPDGRMLASPSADRTIRLWDAESGVCMHTLMGHDGVAFAVTFDPTGQMLASAGLDESVMLWSTAKGEFLRNLGTHHAGAFTVAFNSSNGTLV